MHCIFTQQPDPFFPPPFSQLWFERIQYLASSCIQDFPIYVPWRCRWISQFLNMYPSFFKKSKPYSWKLQVNRGRAYILPNKGPRKWAPSKPAKVKACSDNVPWRKKPQQRISNRKTWNFLKYFPNYLLNLVHLDKCGSLYVWRTPSWNWNLRWLIFQITY